MALTTSGALKAFIESQGLGLAAFRDRAPEGQPRPYARITEAISMVPDASGTAYDSPGVREQAQVSLFQDYKSDANALVESPALAVALHRALHGAVLVPVGDAHVYGCRVLDDRRLLEPPDNPTVVHNAMTVELARSL